jgi:hypothetical protein
MPRAPRTIVTTKRPRAEVGVEIFGPDMWPIISKLETAITTIAASTGSEPRHPLFHFVKRPARWQLDFDQCLRPKYKNPIAALEAILARMRADAQPKPKPGAAPVEVPCEIPSWVIPCDNPAEGLDFEFPTQYQAMPSLPMEIPEPPKPCIVNDAAANDLFVGISMAKLQEDDVDDMVKACIPFLEEVDPSQLAMESFYHLRACASIPYNAKFDKIKVPPRKPVNIFRRTMCAFDSHLSGTYSAMAAFCYDAGVPVDMATVAAGGLPTMKTTTTALKFVQERFCEATRGAISEEWVAAALPDDAAQAL